MKVRLFNIQGFRGDYTYVIDDLITVINSKHNGVGKTTLYDCLRFLCDYTLFDEEERALFLNLNEEEALFSVKVDNVIHGFAINSSNPPIFFKKVDGEDLEKSYENFPGVAQDIGILSINGALLNLFSKEVNLFSNSNTKNNYQLIKEITTHQQTEEMLGLLERSIVANKSKLNELRAEKRGVDAQVQAIPFYLLVDELEELLDNDFYEDLDIAMTKCLELADNLSEVPDLKFNSSIEHLINIQAEIDYLHPTACDIPDVYTLELLLDIEENISLLHIGNPYVPAVDCLEELLATNTLIESLMTTTKSLELNVEPLENLQVLNEIASNLEVVNNLTLDSSLLNHLRGVSIQINQLAHNYNTETTSMRLVEDRRKKLSTKRVRCPIREEVYLIGDKCVY